MVRLYDMFPTVSRHHQAGYGLGHQTYAYQYPPQYDDSGTACTASMEAANNGTGYQQSCSWPVYVATTSPNRQPPVIYEDWMTTASGQCQGGQTHASFGYNTAASAYHLQRDLPTGATDYSMQSSGSNMLLGPIKTDVGHPSPDSATAVSSDGMSGSESPGLTLSLEGHQGGQGLCKPQQARSPYEWMKKVSYQSQPNPGKTRTKDKYRVVYTDNQRLELEKEFHYSRYITIRRKAELANMLGLSERQVKIWFQNRRAKERKQAKKREEIIQKGKDPMLQSNVALAALNNIFKPIVHYEPETHSHSHVVQNCVT